MEFEWDDEKNRINIGKHGLGFELASRIFDGPTVSWIDDRLEYGEIRVRTVGMIGEILFLSITHTDRQGICRIISARPASKKERKIYNENALPKGTEH
jgi:uncharacterized protein